MGAHMKLQKLVDHLDTEYERRLRFLAQKLLNEYVIPVCKRQKLSFTVMNGVPRFVGQSGNYVDYSQMTTIREKKFPRLVGQEVDKIDKIDAEAKNHGT